MTTTSDQNSLRQLEAKIKGVPAQDALLRQRHLFRGAREEALLRRVDLQQVLDQVQALRTIQGNPNLLADSQRKKLATVRAKGRELLNLVGEPSPESAKFGEKLEAIKRTTKGLSDEAKTTWVELCQGHQERANALKALAQHLSPSLVQCLQDLDEFLRRYNHERPHQGRGMRGRTPFKAFLEGRPKPSDKPQSETSAA